MGKKGLAVQAQSGTRLQRASSFPHGASLRVVGLGDPEDLLALITEN